MTDLPIPFHVDEGTQAVIGPRIGERSIDSERHAIALEKLYHFMKYDPGRCIGQGRVFYINVESGIRKGRHIIIEDDHSLQIQLVHAASFQEISFRSPASVRRAVTMGALPSRASSQRSIREAAPARS